MRILYAALDQAVPGTTGGSIHVAAVAKGLAALGHDVHVLASTGRGPFPAGSATWYPVGPPLGLRQLRLLASRRVLRIAERVQPDVIMERYYNFAGEGLRAARSVGALTALEVNAPIVDYPGSPKRILDRALIIEPMRRWREWQCRLADVLVTPHASIVPSWVPRDRILETEWGADTELFRPRVEGPVPFSRSPGDIVAVFAGAFRPWHGARHLVQAIGQLRRRGQTDIKAVLIGDGPELNRVRAAARGIDGVTFTGAIPHERMPACLAAADIGVAPFDVSAHPPLALGFYWSPLKIFEYMAAGLPVVAPALPRLSQLVGDQHHGVLYDPLAPEGLAAALETLVDPDRRARLGAAARERVIRLYSWQAHCEMLAQGLTARLDRRPTER